MTENNAIENGFCRVFLDLLYMSGLMLEGQLFFIRTIIIDAKVQYIDSIGSRPFTK